VGIMRCYNVRSWAGALMVHVLVLGPYLAHVYYMLAIRFDYGLNTKLGISVTAIASGHWFLFAFLKRERRYHWKMWVFEVFGWMAAMNEVFDYAPIFDLLDAHAVWHGATAPLSILWWSYLLSDARFEGAIAQRSKLD